MIDDDDVRQTGDGYFRLKMSAKRGTAIFG